MAKEKLASLELDDEYVPDDDYPCYDDDDDYETVVPSYDLDDGAPGSSLFALSVAIIELLATATMVYFIIKIIKFLAKIT